MKSRFLAAATVAVAFVATSVSATPFTTTPPNGGVLPSGVTPVGGIVLNLIGLNGAQVTTEAAASSLYVGYASTNPQNIGVQTGFTSGILAALGGGLSSASARVTLFDGDSAPGDFDDGQNTFLINGVDFGNFTNIATQETSTDGSAVLSSGSGFGNNILSTGFFSLTSAPDLSSFYTSLGGSTATFALNDLTPGDNFYDFTQGVDGSLINVGTGPIVSPPSPPTSSVPETGTWAMMIFGFGAVGGMMRRAYRRSEEKFTRKVRSLVNA